MEDAVRVRYIKASLEVEKDEWGRGKSVKLEQAHTLEVGGRRVGTTDDKGNVTLHDELADSLFTVGDDPFADIQAENGVRSAKVTVEGQNFKLNLHVEFILVATVGLRVRLPSPEVLSPCCATIVEVNPGSIVCAIDNSEEQVELSHGEKTTIHVCTVLRRPEGQRLVVLYEGKLTDAIVVASPWDPSTPARHRLSLPAGGEIELDLNEFNHCVQRLESASAYEAARASFCASLRESCATVQDAITGTQLRVEDQTLQINPDYSRGVQYEKWVKAPTIKDLAPLLLERSSNRSRGAHEVVPGLIEAPPGTGKVCVCPCVEWSSRL